MCTALSWKGKEHLFGRTLDLNRSCGEEILLIPQGFPLCFRHKETVLHHYAMVGMGIRRDGFPLLFEATNEKGLSMAGLNFPGNAVYHPMKNGADNITPFEFIPWILGQCADCDEAEQLLARINLLEEHFSNTLTLSPLHWLISDPNRSITAEPGKQGLSLYTNPLGILTNNPPFPQQMTHLSLFLGLSPQPAENRFSPRMELEPLSHGMGAMGLPGDLSSPSRFVRAAFVAENLREDEESVSCFFRVMSAVEQQKGCAWMGEGWEYTVYTSCCDAKKGVFYYTTYQNRQITALDLKAERIDDATLKCFPLIRQEQIHRLNEKI